MKKPKKLGMLLLGIWLILTGVMQIVDIPIPEIVLSVLAIAAGALLIYRK